jgi:hypothetical protein
MSPVDELLKDTVTGASPPTEPGVKPATGGGGGGSVTTMHEVQVAVSDPPEPVAVKITV